MKKLLTVFLLFVSGWCVGQAPAIEWQKCYGGTSSESVSDIQPTNDGGYIVAGTSRSADGDVTSNHGENDLWIVKLDDEGSIQWQKSLGGPGSDSPADIKETFDGGYIIAGLTTANGGDVSGYHNSGWSVPGFYDGWVVKIDSVGNIDWQICLGGTGASEMSTSVLQLADSGYIVAGKVNSSDGNVTCLGHGNGDGWIVKLNTNGEIIWQECYGGSGDESFMTIQETFAGGFILAANSTSVDGDVTGNHGNTDYWIVKLDTLGVIEWQKSYGGIGGDVVRDIQSTSDGGYFITGDTYSTDGGDITGTHGGGDSWVLKTDSIGIIQWQKSLGGTNTEYTYSGIQTYDNGFLVAGVSFSNDGDVTGNQGNGDYWLIKLDTTGSIQWQKSLGGTSADWGQCVIEVNNDEYIVGGYTGSNDGDVTNNHGSIDCWIIKLSNSVETSDIDDLKAEFSLYPNPATTTLTLTTEQTLKNAELKIMNAIGQEVSHPLSRGECASLSAGKGCVIDISQFPSGLYYLTLQSLASGEMATKKFEVIR